MISLGIDIGSSSVKIAIYSQKDGNVLSSAQFPETEMKMIAHQPGWAEQEPDWWWSAFKEAYKKALQKAQINSKDIVAIGIAYQMHGLVCLDKSGNPLRPSIIWCDSRAVSIGEKALKEIGETYAFNHLLNSPGNFTASKLKWVKDVEPDLFEAIDKICLPGDYIAYRLTGELTTTITGISEGIFYDFKEKNISTSLLAYYGFSENLFPPVYDAFGNHGTVSKAIATELGLSANVKVTYKAGDQPNNALSLNVLQPGEIAATAGTSGVVYGVSDSLFIDYAQRVNSFAHVNYKKSDPRIGILLCINGTGIANAWAYKQTKAESYAAMNAQALTTIPGSEGLSFFPFGNGAERMLGNKNLGSSLSGLNFNLHTPAHLYRAVQEGIAFAFMYGMEAFAENDITLKVIRAGQANMFQSSLFGELLATLSGVEIELYDTDGALGAARGALIGAELSSFETVFQHLRRIHTYEPNPNLTPPYQSLYQQWKNQLLRQLKD